MNVVLVGFMGSGKTAVGRRIAQRLGYTLLDTDQFIEDQVGCTIAQLFDVQGEAYFRDLENRLAAHLHKLNNHVISTGGGMPIGPGNLERLRAAGRTVFLNADPEEIVQRLERDTRRPKLKGGELRETVARLLAERTPHYAQSEITIDTKGKSVNRVAGAIIALLAGHKDAPPETETEGEAGPAAAGGGSEEETAPEPEAHQEGEAAAPDGAAAPAEAETEGATEAAPGEPEPAESETDGEG